MKHETQRLLVAASRGARVQTPYGADGNWHTTSIIYTLSQELHRLHPDDIELQYGPVSTELRRRAAVDDQRIMVPPEVFMADVWWHYCRGTKDVLPGSETGSWLCLFAAELAADEGL